MEHRWSVRRRARSERGALLLLWALSWSVMLLLLVLGDLPLQQTASLISRRSFGQAQALAAAEAGIEQGILEAHGGLVAVLNSIYRYLNFGLPLPGGPALWDINGDGTFNAYDLLTAYAISIRGWSSGCGNPPQCSTMAGTLAAGNYTVTVWSAPPNWLPKGGPSVPEVVIESTGYAPGSEPVRLRVVLAHVAQTFSYAAFGGDAIELAGRVLVDSYFSGAGWLGYGYGFDQTARSSHGHIGTNATDSTPYALNIHGDPKTQIQGTAYLPTLDAPTRVEPTGQPTGGIKPLIQRVTLPPVVVPDTTGWYVPPGGSDLVLSSGTTTCDQPTKLTSLRVAGTGVYLLGDYCKLVIEGAGGTPLLVTESGKIKLDSPAGVGIWDGRPVDKPIQIFVRNGSFESSSQEGIVNYARDGNMGAPDYLQIFVTGTGASGHLKQKDPFSGVVRIEHGDLLVETYDTSAPVDVYGSLIADGKLTLRGGDSFSPLRVHFDESLSRFGGLPPPATYDGKGAGIFGVDRPFRILQWHRDEL